VFGDLIYCLLRRHTPFLKVEAAFYSETLASVRNVTWLTGCTTAMSPLDSFLNTLNPSSHWTYRMTAEVITKSQGGGKYPTYSKRKEG